MTKTPKSCSLAIRLTDESRKLLDDAQSILPYAPSLTTIVERGIVLATEEMKALAAILKERQS